MMAILEGKWDCEDCNTEGIPGGLLNCPTCKQPRNVAITPSEAPYLPDDAREVTDPEKLKAANSGPEWYCGFCGQAVVGAAKICPSCNKPLSNDDVVAATRTFVDGVNAVGVPVSSSQEVDNDWTDTVLQSADKLQQLEDGPVKTPDRTLHSSDLPRDGSELFAVEEPDPAPVTTQTLSVDTAKRWASSLDIRMLQGAGVVFALIIVIIVGGFVYTSFFKTHDVNLTVQQLDWERQVEVEEFRTLTRDDWSVPSDGRIQSSRRAIHHYDRVLDHYEDRTRQVGERVATGSHTESYACGSTTVDNGNGYFETKTTYCDRTVTDYTTVYHDEHYKEPIYRNDPVYRTKYVYEIDRWVTDYFEKADESDGSKPYWPEPKDLDRKQRIGDERLQSYTVVLTDEENREFERELTATEWSNLSEGEVVPAQQTRRGAVRSVNWPSS